MPENEPLQEIASRFSPEAGVSVGKWFGKPCIQIGKKVFVILWGRDLAFKLADESHANGLKVAGAHLFDPRGRGNPMKEWVQIPAEQSSEWDKFAKLAYEYILTAAE
jgi:hypothetical protein